MDETVSQRHWGQPSLRVLTHQSLIAAGRLEWCRDIGAGIRQRRVAMDSTNYENAVDSAIEIIRFPFFITFGK